MKPLKFTPPLAAQILAESKRSTFRLFDDKDLREGDELQLINNATFETFGTATIRSVTEKTLGTLTDEDWEGHERYASEAEMYAAYRSYYGDNVTPDTAVKIIQFEFTPLASN